jgi:hypothetical protein
VLVEDKVYENELDILLVWLCSRYVDVLMPINALYPHELVK